MGRTVLQECRTRPGRQLDVADAVKTFEPGIAELTRSFSKYLWVELTGAVDIWCPQVHKYQQNMAFFTERKAAGDEVWVYTCLVPGGPWYTGSE